MITARRIVMVLGLVHGLVAQADGYAPQWFRVPKDDCHTYGDPAVVSSGTPFSIEKEEDVSISTPRGRFSLFRTYVGERRALGQTLTTATGNCQLPVINRVALGLLKAPHGQNFSSEPGVTINNLTTIVDTRCDYVRVLTPDGDTRFFYKLPKLDPGKQAWVERTTEAMGEPSRLLASRDAKKGLWAFDWYSEDGRRFHYASYFPWTGDNGQYRMTAAYGSDGTLQYEVDYGYPSGGYAIPGQDGIPAVLADGGPKIYPGSSNALGACEVTLEPLQVRFPETDVKLRLVYRNPPSAWADGAELPNFDCVVARVDIANGGVVSTAVEYEYSSPPVQGAQWSSAHLTKAKFSEGGTPNGWTLLQPPAPGVLTWARGLLVERPDEIAAAAQGTELTVTHAPGPSVDNSFLFYEDQGSPPSYQLVDNFDSVGCTNCCSDQTFGRKVSEFPYGIGFGKYVEMAYYSASGDGNFLPGWGSTFGALPQSNTQICEPTQYSCESGTISYHYGRVASESGEISLRNACGISGQPVALLASTLRNGATTTTPTVYKQQQGGVFERTSVSLGGTSLDDASKALSVRSFTYEYLQNVQFVASIREASVIDPAAEVVTTITRAANGRIRRVVRSGYTRSEGTKTLAHFGTFYKTEGRSCSGITEAIGSERIVEVEGPCLLTTSDDWQCADQGETPKTEFFYYGGALPPVSLTQTASQFYNSGRLAMARTFANGCSVNSVLQTQFGSYSAEGEPDWVLDPNKAPTTKTRTGRLLDSVVLPDGTAYALEWDRGRLAKVTRPEGDSTIYCRGTTGESDRRGAAEVDPVCKRTRTTCCVGVSGPGNYEVEADLLLSDQVLWTADVSNGPKNTLRQTRFGYERDSITNETTYGPGSVVGMACDVSQPCFSRATYSYDVDERLTARYIGTEQSILNTKWHLSARSDSLSELAAMGEGFAFADPSLPSTAEPYCLTAGADNTRCTYFERDRLGRLTGVRWGAPLSTNVKDCFGYDTQGNVSVVTRGCAADASCPILPTIASVSGTTALVNGGPACSSARMEYVWDDFGRLTSFRRQVNGTWSEDLYTYGPTGALKYRQTQAQRAINQKTFLARDGLGRETATAAMTGTTSITLTGKSWDDADVQPPPGCSGTSQNAMGRPTRATAPVWTTWFGYDQLGRVTNEWRVDTATASCPQGDQLAQNSTSYGYRPNGGISQINYPFGRIVRYRFPEAGQGKDPNLPEAVTVGVFEAPTWAGDQLEVISEIEWTPLRDLKSYVFNNYVGVFGGVGVSSYQTKVTYDYGVGGSDTRPTACGSVLANSIDATGRLRRMRVTANPHGPGPETTLYERWYTWAADQVVAIDICYEGQTGYPLNEFLAPVNTTPLGYDLQGKLTKNDAVYSAGGNIIYNGHSYGYDSLGNRLTESFTATSSQTWKSTIDNSSSQISRLAPWSGGAELPSNRAYKTFAHDADGRLTNAFAATDSTGAPNSSVTYGFPNGSALANGGVDSVLRTANVDGQIYNYYYDGSNRRTRKVHPNGAMEDYFYDLDGRLISERSFTGLTNSTGNTVDEYVWLAGIPVMAIRSVFDGAMNRVTDWNPQGAGCPRRNVPGPCGFLQIVSDHMGKPVLAMDGNMNVTGVGEYDAFGYVNRVRMNFETPHPYANNATINMSSSVGRTPTTGSSNQQTVFRARFSFIDANTNSYFCNPTPPGGCRSNDRVEVSQGGTVLAQLSGTSLGAAVTPFLTQQGTFDIKFVSDVINTGDGAVFSGYDYDRTSIGVYERYFPPLRFPGQYYDAETDLHENWNRYYDPGMGRYLSPEPALVGSSPLPPDAMAQSIIRWADTASVDELSEVAAQLWPNGTPTVAQMSAPMTLPLYSYAANNPLRYGDPNGRLPIVIGGVAIGTGVIVGGVVIIGSGIALSTCLQIESCRRGISCVLQYLADIARCAGTTAQRLCRGGAPSDRDALCYERAANNYTQCKNGRPRFTGFPPGSALAP